MGLCPKGSAYWMRHRLGEHENQLSIMPELKDSCDPPKYSHSFIFVNAKLVFLCLFYLGFTAHQDNFTHFEPSQLLGLRWGKNGRFPKKKTPDHPQAELGLSHM